MCLGVSSSLWLLPLFPGRLGLPGQGRGAGSGLCLPPHAPPRGPDSGVRGRTGDARPVYPPRAASAPTGGAARAREGEEREARPDSGFATCPGAPHPETQDLQVLLPQIQAFRLQPSSLRPRSPNLSSPPSEPGVQTLALILQIQGPEAQPSLPQTQNPGFIPPPPDRKVQTSSPSKPKFWTLAYLTQTQVLDFLEAEESRPQPY